MKTLTREELFADFDELARVTVVNRAAELSASYVVRFENQDFCSSELGRSTLVMVGPTCTFKSPAHCEGKWLNDLPSQRQYPVGYIAVDALVRE